MSVGVRVCFCLCRVSQATSNHQLLDIPPRHEWQSRNATARHYHCITQPNDALGIWTQTCIYRTGTYQTIPPFEMHRPQRHRITVITAALYHHLPPQHSTTPTSTYVATPPYTICAPHTITPKHHLTTTRNTRRLHTPRLPRNHTARPRHHSSSLLHHTPPHKITTSTYTTTMHPLAVPMHITTAPYKYCTRVFFSGSAGKRVRFYLDKHEKFGTDLEVCDDAHKRPV